MTPVLNPKPLLAALAAGLVAGLAIDAFILEPSRVAITHHDVPVPGLPEGWDGARVVHLTDIHFGNPRSARLLHWTVDAVNALEPDLIVITGDFIVHRPSEVPPCMEFVGQLRAKHRVHAVLGDHDFVHHTTKLIPGILEGLDDAGVHVLRNSAVELPGGFWLAGVDPSSDKIDLADVATAVRDVPCHRPHLFLAHSPDIISQAAVHAIPWVLCGHTHGGQVVVPFYGPPITHTRVGRKYASGWSRQAQTRMYTGRGLGSHYSLRFLCRPEIAVFTLHGGETEP